MVKQVLYTLASGLVLDAGALFEQDTDGIQTTLDTVRAAGPIPLIVINGADTFFTQAKLVDFIAHKDVKARLVNEQIDLFNEDQMNVLLGGVVPKPQVGDQHGEGEIIVGLGKAAPVAAAPVGIYAFAAVPPGWSVTNNMSLGPTKIKRKVKNTDGDGTLFYIGPTDFEKLWAFASAAWSGIPNVPIQAYFKTGMGNKQATVQDDRIAIGGNFIRRYEIEQVAKYRGWAMPAVGQLHAA